MINNFSIKTFLTRLLSLVILHFATGHLTAQINHSFQLNYAGTTLKGSVDVFVKIVDKAPDSKNKAIQFSGKKIKTGVSKFKKPSLVVTFSNLTFKAPKDLTPKLGLDISFPVLPKGFAQKSSIAIQGPLKINEKRVYDFEIVPSDTILVGDVTFKFNSIQIGKRSFKLKDNAFELSLNITPPPLFPTDATEKEIWKIASKLKTIKAYDVYIERFPQGKSIQLAKRQKKNLIARPRIDSNNNGGSGPLTNIPIFSKDENKLWGNAKKANKIEGYNAYLKTFPKGKHVKEATTYVRSLSDSLNVKVLRSAEDELKGRLIYHIEDTMTIGQTYRVRLEISSDTTAHFIEKLITTVEEYSDNPQDLNTEIIEIDNTMRAHLEDSAPEEDKNFYIHLFGEKNEREVDLYSSEPTIWEWDVRPLKKGYHPLYFTIEIITKKDGHESPKILPVYDSEITILSQSIFQTYKIQFIAGGIIIILLLIILVLFLKKNKEKNQEKDLDKLLKINPLEGTKALIENDQLQPALDFLDTFLTKKDKELNHEIILLKSRLANNNNNLNTAIISKEEASNERNKIKLATLDIIERAKIFG